MIEWLGKELQENWEWYIKWSKDHPGYWSQIFVVLATGTIVAVRSSSVLFTIAFGTWTFMFWLSGLCAADPVGLVDKPTQDQEAFVTRFTNEWIRSIWEGASLIFTLLGILQLYRAIRQREDTAWSAVLLFAGAAFIQWVFRAVETYKQQEGDNE